MKKTVKIRRTFTLEGDEEDVIFMEKHIGILFTMDFKHIKEMAVAWDVKVEEVDVTK